jgi:hypothetical protein
LGGQFRIPKLKGGMNYEITLSTPPEDGPKSIGRPGIVLTMPTGAGGLGSRRYRIDRAPQLETVELSLQISFVRHEDHEKAFFEVRRSFSHRSNSKRCGTQPESIPE